MKDDMISRQAALDALEKEKPTPFVNKDGSVDPFGAGRQNQWYRDDIAIMNLPSAQPEQLTDKEQRIFLAAMSREEKICKQVDDECRDCREPYEDSLVRTCHEIIRKVIGALWT